MNLGGARLVELGSHGQGVCAGMVGLGKSISWSLLGTGVYAVTQWGMLLALGRLGGPEAVGRFLSALALGAPIILLTNLSLRQMLASDPRMLSAFGDFLGLRLLTSGVGFVLIVSVALIVYSGDSLLVVVFVGLAKAIEAVSDVCHGFAQGHERLHLYALSNIARGLFGLAVLAGVLVVTGDLVWAACGMALSWGAVLCSFDIPSAVRLFSTAGMVDASSFRVRCLPKRAWWTLARSAAPLGASAMLLSLNAMLPRYFIEGMLGTAMLGVYGAATYLATAVGVVLNAVWQACLPRLGRRVVRREWNGFLTLLARLSVLALAAGFVAVVAAYLFGSGLLAILYGSAFRIERGLLVAIMFAGAAEYLSSYLGSALVPLRAFGTRLRVLAVVAIVHATLAFALVREHGVIGAAWATTIAFALYAALALGVIRSRSGRGVGRENR